MSRYRKVDPKIWNDAKFRELSDEAKLVFFMLLTHPNMTALGAMRATVSGLSEELGWEPEAFREAFREALAKGMAEHDPKACFVALPNFLRYNPPESPNVIKAWAGSLDLLPECGLKFVVIQRAKDFAEGLSEGFAKALPEAFAKGMPYQDQEQEQEQEQEKSQSSLRSDSVSAEEQDDAPQNPADLLGTVTKHPESKVSEVVIEAYHAILPKCARIAVLNPKRNRRILLADKLAKQVCRNQGWEYDARTFWRAYFTECGKDPWMRGEVPNPKNVNWKQNIDVLLDEDRFAKIMDATVSSLEAAA